MIKRILLSSLILIYPLAAFGQTAVVKDFGKSTERNDPVNWKTTRTGNVDVPWTIVTNPDGSNISGGAGAGGDASAANQTSVQAIAGSDASKAVSIQGITGGKAVPVSGTFWQATQPVSLATNTPDVTDRSARLLGHVTVDNASIPVTGTFWQATQPVSGSITANIGTSGSLALDASVTGLQVSQGSTTSGQKGNLLQGAVTTAAPSYTTAQTNPLSLTTTGALRVDGSAVTQPVSGTFWQATQPISGTVTANQGGTWTVQPGNTANTTAWKVDGSAVTQPVSGTFWQATQPISGTVTANAGTNLNTSALALESGGNLASIKTDVDNLNLAQGSTTSGQKGQLTLAATTTAAPTYTTAQSNPLSLTTAGALRVDNSAVTQPVSGTVSITANSSVNVAQVAGSAAVASVTGVQDVMPRKRTGSTGLSPNYTANHITTAATATPTAATAYLSTIQINVSVAGASSTITIKNKEATAKIAAQVSSAAIGNFTYSFVEPILMTSGIDITSTATAPTADVFLTYWQ